MKYYKKYSLLITILAFVILAIYFLYNISNSSLKDEYLKVIFLNVGQGDAIYIESPNGRQMLIDGGRDENILAKLTEVMPFADRSIDVVIATNPDEDHIGGLVDVLDNYKVGYVIESGTKNDDSYSYQKFEKEIEEKKIEKKIALRGMKIILDDEKNIYLDILFPDRDVRDWERNDGSIVGRLVYNKKSFMFMGDATRYTENLIKWNENPENLKSNVLKLGHHGSKTSSSILWLELVQPQIAIISAGEHNSYGHPNVEVLDNLKSLNIPYLATYEKGNILFKTDGINLIY